MKGYRMWLKAGGCIEGELEDRAAEELQGAFLSSAVKYTMKDTDGILLVDTGQISAIAIVEPMKDKTIEGFSPADRIS